MWVIYLSFVFYLAFYLSLNPISRTKNIISLENLKICYKDWYYSSKKNQIYHSVIFYIFIIRL